MSVQLDWQQDLEEEGWPRRHDYGPPNRGSRRGRYALIAFVVLLAVGASVLWVMNQRGLQAVKADVQEAVTYIHWTLQQNDPELTINTLDRTSPRWVELARTEWQRVSAAALAMPPPTVESVSMDGNIAEATVRWTDATSGNSYLARRWFRLDGKQWLWTQPRALSADELQTEQLPHVTLSFHRDDGDIVPALLPLVDDLIADRCQQFAVSEQSCHFYLQWDVADAGGQPLLWRDMALPPLASTSGDEMDAPIYLVNGREADWRSAELRRRLQQFYPGRIFVAQSSLSMMRPADARQLPDSLLGDPSSPLVLPAPSLEGIDDQGQPHSRWLAYVDRQLTDLVLRRAEGYTLGSADYVHATWALHQALLAIATGLPSLEQLDSTDKAAPASAPPVAMPDLSGLGAALQSNPDSVAMQQLEGLARYLQDNWSADQIAGLSQHLGVAGNLDLLLEDALASDRDQFLAGWRQQEREDPASPLSTLINQLMQHAADEAAGWTRSLERSNQALRLYTESGRDWRRRTMSDAEALGQLQYSDQWQAQIGAIGAIGSHVWVEVTQSDGERTARDLGFYVLDPEEGWLRDRPVRAFWGNPRSATTELTRWEYYEIDEDAVQAVMPMADAAYRQVAADFGLPIKPLTVTVDADTAAPLGPDRALPGITVASPRSYTLHDPADEDHDALRRDLLLRLALSASQAKADLMTAGGTPYGDEAWNILVSAILAELEKLDVPTASLLGDVETPVQDALAADRLPELSRIAIQPAQAGSIEQRAQWLLGIFIFQRYGFQWLDTVLNDGLPVTLDALMQQESQTLDDLEQDWRAFLAARAAQ